MFTDFKRKLTTFLGWNFQEKIYQLLLIYGATKPRAAALAVFFSQRLKVFNILKRRRTGRRLPDVDMSISRQTGYLRIPAKGVHDDRALRQILNQAQAYAEAHFPSEEEYDSFLQKNRSSAPLYNIIEYGGSKGSHEIANIKAFSELYRVLVDDAILKIVSNYLGGIPTIESVGIFYTKNNATTVGSQLFHHHAGINYSKPGEVGLFMNLSDVTEGNGPFTYIDAKQSYDVVMNRALFSGSKISDDAVEHRIDAADIHQLIGKSGEALFCDGKRCLHYGGRAREGTRLILIAFFSLPQNGRVARTSVREMTNRSLLAENALDRLILNL